MNKKETDEQNEKGSQNLGAEKMITSEKSKKKKDKALPWWVELLFVQIGLPDKLLIKILKAKKESKQLLKNDKKFVFTFFFSILVLAYLYPIVKNANNKLNCVAIAKSYIIKNKNIISIKKRELKMLSTNFCNGGEEIYELEKSK